MYSTQRIDHLGLISGLIDEIGVVEYIDSIIPKTSNNTKMSHGELLKAMLLNGLGFTSQPLYLYSEFFSEKALDKLFKREVDASEINDKALGRTLDTLYDYGLNDLYFNLAEKIITSLGINVNTAHIDTTSFHVDGNKYENTCVNGVKITHGYSKDHRPDLQQVILNLIVDNKSSIPLFFQAINGNQSDKVTGFKYANTNLSLHTFYSAENMKCKKKSAIKRISKLTSEEHKEFKKLLKEQYDCETDAEKELQKFTAKLKFSAVCNIHIVKEIKANSAYYKIHGDIFSVIAKQKDYISKLGYFTLATNAHELSSIEVLSKYKEQQRVERGFRFLKSDEFFTSAIYLKTPERIESLLMIMTLSLAVYSAIEYKIRLLMVAKNVFFLDQKKEETKNPTARWVFYCFKGIDILMVDAEDIQFFILNLQDRHKTILDLLGDSYWKYYR